MGFLFDTHALIWWLDGDERFPVSLREEILSNQNRMWVSPVSFWEISVKRSLGKLELKKITPQMWYAVDEQGFSRLPIAISHLSYLEQLPFHHRDPFDRLLIAQAQAERHTLLSRDGQFEPYDVACKWG